MRRAMNASPYVGRRFVPTAGLTTIYLTREAVSARWAPSRG
jgi:hypothetical protein